MLLRQSLIGNADLVGITLSNLALLIELITEYCDCECEYPDDEVKGVTAIHVCAPLSRLIALVALALIHPRARETHDHFFLPSGPN
jgi:hypothetical protein